MSETEHDRGPLAVTVDRLPNLVGVKLGPSRWVTLDQEMIDGFGALTGDEHWIHTDPDRAKAELPGGKTLVHGYFTLALITDLLGDLLDITFDRALNYGLDRVRFLSPVPAGARLRLFATPAEAAEVEGGGMKLALDCTLELGGAERPALVARTISIFYP
jgi:acyl dehydratase